MKEEKLGAFEKLKEEIEKLKKEQIKWVKGNQPWIIVLTAISIAGCIVLWIGATVWTFMNERSLTTVISISTIVIILFLLFLFISSWRAMKKEKVKIGNSWEELRGRTEEASLTSDERKELRAKLNSILLLTNMKAIRALRGE